MKALGQFVTGAIGDITVTIELLVSNGDLIANRNSARGVRKSDGAEISWTEQSSGGLTTDAWSSSGRWPPGSTSSRVL